MIDFLYDYTSVFDGSGTRLIYDIKTGREHDM